MSDTMNETPESTVWKFSDAIEFDLAELPQAVVWRATQRGLNHVLSNEASSKAGTVAKKMIAAGELSQDQYEAKAKELADDYRLEYVAAFFDGSWGSGRRVSTGPRLDAFDSAFAKLLAKTVRTYLNNKLGKGGVTYDKATKTWSWMTNSGLQTRTIEEAIEGYESKMKPAEREALETAAREMVDAAKRAAEASKSAVMEDDEMAL